MAACLNSEEGPLCGHQSDLDKLLWSSDTKWASPHMGIQLPLLLRLLWVRLLRLQAFCRCLPEESSALHRCWPLLPREWSSFATSL